jgi:hypothetical protein
MVANGLPVGSPPSLPLVDLNLASNALGDRTEHDHPIPSKARVVPLTLWNSIAFADVGLQTI